MHEDVGAANVLEGISQLYEFALAAGKSLDPQENCEVFLSALMGRKNVDFAAVWIRDTQLFESEDREAYVPFYSSPSFRSPTEALAADDPLLSDLEDQPAKCVKPQHVEESGLRIRDFGGGAFGDRDDVQVHGGRFSAVDLNPLPARSTWRGKPASSRSSSETITPNPSQASASRRSLSAPG